MSKIAAQSVNTCITYNVEQFDWEMICSSGLNKK